MKWARDREKRPIDRPSAAENRGPTVTDFRFTENRERDFEAERPPS
jgi:hypothetical protein